MSTRFSLGMRKYCRIWYRFWLLDTVNVLNATLCPKLCTLNTYLIMFYKFYLTLFIREKVFSCVCLGSTFINKKIMFSLRNLLLGSALKICLYLVALCLHSFPFLPYSRVYIWGECNSLHLLWVMFYWLISTCFKLFKIFECAWVMY